MRGPHYGHVTDQGELVLESRSALRAHARKLAGKRVELVLRLRRSKRSVDQNKWLWGCAIPRLADALGYEPHEREHHEAIHYGLVETRFGTHFDERLKRHVPNARSSKLTTVQFSDYMEWLVRHAATEHGCYIPLPDEVDLNEIELPDSEVA